METVLFFSISDIKKWELLHDAWVFRLYMDWI